MKVKFTAEIIDDNGNIIGTSTSEADGIPSLEQFELSTRDGSLRNLDAMEKAIFKARDQIDGDIIGGILADAIQVKRGLQK